ncbi:Uncharacterised protein [Mycobacteroides abscessus subsp. abscessus]|nr:Uncharacterised protein [Mycobacteroides abscessus subsp. abscessus]
MFVTVISQGRRATQVLRRRPSRTAKAAPVQFRHQAHPVAQAIHIGGLAVIPQIDVDRCCRIGRSQLETTATLWRHQRHADLPGVRPICYGSGHGGESGCIGPYFKAHRAISMQDCVQDRMALLPLLTSIEYPFGVVHHPRAHARQIDNGLHPHRVQFICRAQPRQQQQLCALDSPRAQNDSIGGEGSHRIAHRHLNSGCLSAAAQHSQHAGAGVHDEIGTPHRALQVGACGPDPDAGVDVERYQSHPGTGRAIEISDHRVSPIDGKVHQFCSSAALFVPTANRYGSLRSVQRIVLKIAVGFYRPEVIAHLRPGPPRHRPSIEVRRPAPHEVAAVDRPRAPHHGSAYQFGLIAGGRQCRPVVGGYPAAGPNRQAVPVPHPGLVRRRRRTRLDEHHSKRRVLRKAACQNRTRASCAHNERIGVDRPSQGRSSGRSAPRSRSRTIPDHSPIP